MRAIATARPRFVVAMSARWLPGKRSITVPTNGPTTAKGASVRSRYSRTVGLAASADTLKNSDPARDTVKSASPTTPIEFATTSRRYGSAPTNAATTREARGTAPVCTLARHR